MKRKIQESDENLDDSNKNKRAKTVKKSKNKKTDFSAEEILRLKESEGLFHSSLFRLQVTELLKEVTVKDGFRSKINQYLTTLKNILVKLSAGQTYKITDKKWLQSLDIKIPVCEVPLDVKGSFQFLPPSSIRETGSFSLDTIVQPNINVDLVLQIPKACFQPKDFLNQRYTRKRALYLCTVASHLMKEQKVQDLKFTYLMGNPYKPVLLLTMKVSDKKSVQFRLHAEPEENVFKLSRFELNKNNIRPKWFFGKESEVTEEEDAASLPATPFYNSSILNDLTMKVNDTYVEELLKGSEGIRDGIILLKIWFRQRELINGFGCFSSFVLTAYVAYLVMLKKVNKLMNSFQVFRTTLLYLSKSDWVSEPPRLCEEKASKVFPSHNELGESSFVFGDRTGYYNIAYMVSSSILLRIKQEAALAVSTLDQHHASCFDGFFMTRVSFSHKFDHIFHVKISPSIKEAMCKKLKGFTEQEVDYAGHSSIVISDHIQKLLLKALDKRVTLIQAHNYPCPEWEITENAFSYDKNNYLTFGLVLNVSQAFNVLDKGPPAEIIEAKEFREFWGSKSEMRRFKDGSIHEAVLWTDSTKQSDRRLVCKKIVQHMLDKHYGIPESDITYIEGKIDTLLHLRVSSKDSMDLYGTGEEQTLDALRTFNELNRVVRVLSSIPLSIHSVTGIHPVFRHADVFPALTASKVTKEMEVVHNHVVPQVGRPIPHFVPALDVICLLEGSGKWPEDVAAIQQMKTLFHIKIGKELKEKYSYTVSICNTHLDVLKDGFVFRLKVANAKELAVLRTHKTEDGMVKFRETEESLVLEREIISLPHITSLLHGIQQENPLFSSAMRLCKRWVAAQMVWDFLPEVVIELLVAYIFISPYPYTPPGSPCNGFLRFLHLLATFNWKVDPLMVNLNKEFTDEDFVNIPKEFTKHRSTLPSMCIVTPHDKQGTKWTRPHPTEPVLQRLVVLARESLKIIEAQVMLASEEIDFKLIFRPPLGHYDHIIHLIKKVNISRYQHVDKTTNIQISSPDNKHKVFPLVEFNPARLFVRDLRGVYGDFAMFFHDPFGGDIIGVVWKTEAFDKKDFAVSHFHYRKPVVDDNVTSVSLVLDRETIIDDIRIMGGGIVESITVPKSV